MMKHCVFSMLVLSLTVIANFSAGAQTNNKQKIIGTWSVTDVQFIAQLADSLEIRAKAKAGMVQFIDTANYISKIKEGDTWTIIERGSYAVSPDGKKITQNGTEAVIVLLTDVEMILKLEDEMMIYLKKEAG